MSCDDSKLTLPPSIRHNRHLLPLDKPIQCDVRSLQHPAHRADDDARDFPVAQDAGAQGLAQLAGLLLAVPGQRRVGDAVVCDCVVVDPRK